MNTKELQPEFESQFLEDAKGVMGALRAALLELSVELKADFSVPQDLSRRYKLDKTLTWKISKIVRDEDIASSVVHVPGRRRMTTLLAAMRNGGATERSVESVWRAFDEFERLVQVHSGDRGTLDIMVADANNRTSDRRAETLRKGGYQCNAAVWGVRARMHFAMHALGPAEAKNMLDAFTVCGFLGLERLRLGLPWTVADANSWDTVATEGFRISPLRAEGLIDGAPILPNFCSQPVPAMRVIDVDKSNRRFELSEGSIGLGNAVDLALGWSWPPIMSIYAMEEDEIGEHGMHLSTPVELMVHDLWIHRSLTFAMNPMARVYSRLPNGPRYPHEGRDAGVIPVPDNVIDLGFGAASSSMGESPRSSELLQYAMDQRGWNSNDFRGYRFRLKYPPIPTLSVFQHPLLPPIG